MFITTILIATQAIILSVKTYVLAQAGNHCVKSVLVYASHQGERRKFDALFNFQHKAGKPMDD
jgi:proline dehydrogenase